MEAPQAPLELDDLLQHAGWVRRVAASLVRDAAEADDLAQEVWLRALRERPAQLARPRAWLASVARTLALTRARGSGRRRARERTVARTEATLSTERVVAEAEREREVAALVLALDEPYRSVVLLRFYHDLAPRHIARELGRPVATVKVQLQRGLELLRRELDRRHGSREAWSALLLPLCVPRVPLAALVGAAALTVVLGLAALRWIAGPSLEPELAAATLPPRAEPTRGEVTGAVPGAEPSLPTDRAPRETIQPPATSATPVAVRARPTETLHARLVTPAGEPLNGVRVVAHDPRRLHWADAPDSALVSETTWLPVAPARRAELAASPTARAAFVAAHFTPASPEEQEALLLLAGLALPEVSTRTDATGSFALEVKPRWRELEIADEAFDLVGHGPPATPLGPETELYFASASVRLEGRVLDGFGQPCADALVELATGCPDEVSRQLELGRGLLCATREVRCDADGRFVFERAPRSRVSLSATLEGVSTHAELDLRGEAPPEPLTLRLGLVPPEWRVRVSGTVLRPDGAPAREAQVAFAGALTTTDEEGTFELVLSTFPGGPLAVAEPGYDPLLFSEPEATFAGGTTHALGTLRLPATRLVLAGRVLDAAGLPLPGVALALEDDTWIEELGSLERAASSVGGVQSDAEGRFELRGLLPREYRIRVDDRLFGPFQAGTSGLGIVMESR